MSEPNIQVVLVPLRGSDPDLSQLKCEGIYDYPGRKVVEVGIGKLQVLWIGSLWKDGRFFADPPYARHVFPDLNIDAAGVERIQARARGYATAPDGTRRRAYWIPFGSYSGHKGMLDTWCVRVAASRPGQFLIVPCVELIRFYFSGSSALLRELFNGGLDTAANGVYDPALTVHRPEDVSHLQLRLRMRHSDAPIIARLAFDEAHAGAQARLIHTSLVRSRSNVGKAFPSIRFPFQGTTTLTVRGKWLPFGDGWNFLVYRIEQCTGPFPFGEVEWHHDGDARSDGPADPSLPEAFAGCVPAKRPPANNGGEYPAAEHGEPDLDVDLSELDVPLEDRFPGLRGKVIRQGPRRNPPKSRAAARAPTEAAPGAAYGTGAGTYGKTDILPLSLSVPVDSQDGGQAGGDGQAGSRREPLPASFETLKEILRELEKEPGITCSLVRVLPDPRHPEAPWSVFPTVMTDRGRLLGWSYISAGGEAAAPGVRRRRVMVARIRCKGRLYYLFEAERQKKPAPSGKDKAKEEHFSLLLVHRPDFSDVEAVELREILHGCVVLRRVGLSNDLPGVFQSRPFVHHSTTAGAFAKRLFRYVDQGVQRRANERPADPAPAQSLPGP